MCGIVGILRHGAEQTVDAQLLARMNDALTHRGPDDSGLHLGPGIGLGHRRLSIIDLAGGRQPLYNEDHTVAVVFNGEIYNHAELSTELRALGHRFRTRSDTEVLVHAWEQWGEQSVTRLRGMFAYAVWDQNRRALFLARDRLGIKPLYHATLPTGDFLFGSELKALLVHPRLPREPDLRAMEDFLAFGHIPDPKSILRHVRKLPPGQTLTLRDHRTADVAPRSYWDVPFHDPAGSVNPGAMEIELRERLREAVDVRMIAEVPLGAFLSGGVDSSAVVATMAGLSPGSAINTCSIAFDDPGFNEAEYAQTVADRFRTNHLVETVSVDDFALLDTLARTYDEPFADSSAIPTYRLCQLARRQVTVALSGDGGDEVFAGYPWYAGHMRKERFRRMLPGPVRTPLLSALASIYPLNGRLPRKLHLRDPLHRLAMDAVDSFSLSTMMSLPAVRQRLYGQRLMRELQGYEASDVIRDHARRAPSDHPLSLAQYIDMKVYLPSDILTKVDRASMAHGLEVRVPLLDHRFVEWAGRKIPPGLKLANGKTKAILKHAFEPMLPHDILYRRKMGFSVPIRQWFQGPLKARSQQLTASEHLVGSGLIDRKGLQDILAEHHGGRADHGSTIWSLMVLDACSERLFGTSASLSTANIA
ncbi:MAG: XrtA/PEP-CTERM system amidotransferase [Aquisalimonadaceae bacterium]